MSAKSGMSVEYAVTFTTKGRFKDNTSEDQFDKIAEDIYQNNIIPKEVVQWTLIGELHKDKSSVHVHGIVRFNMRLIPARYLYYPPRYLTDHLKKIKYFGFSFVKQIDDFKGWFDYIRKDIDEFRRITNRCAIIIDDFDYFQEYLKGFEA